MEAQLASCVRRSLRLCLYANAIFLAERLAAASPTEANVHLLATCYLRNQQPHRAYCTLTGAGAKSPRCRYLLALACHALNKLPEAEAALLSSSSSAAPIAENVPNGAAGYYLLGLICRQTDRRQAAVLHYRSALAKDPFLWSAYHDLCLLGELVISASEIGFCWASAREELCHELQQMGWHGKAGAEDAVVAAQDEAEAALHSETVAHKREERLEGVGLVDTPQPQMHIPSPSSAQQGTFTTPSPMSPPENTGGAPRLLPGARAQQAATGRTRAAYVGDRPVLSAADVRSKFFDEGKLRKVSGRLFAEGSLSGASSGGTRRSSRLAEGNGNSFNGGSASRVMPMSRQGSSRRERSGRDTGFGEVGASGEHDNSSSPTMPSPRVRAAIVSNGAVARLAMEDAERGSVARLPEAEGHEREEDEEAVEDEEEEGLTSQARSRSSDVRNLEGRLKLLELVRNLVSAFRSLCMFRCQEALDAFSQLPAEQYATGWVLSQVGRAYFEAAEYAEAERAFAWSRTVCPHQVEGLDIFSTVLYHMKKEVELSCLAQEAVTLDRLSPQTWCVLGNCMSLQKEHETALKYFQRALQLDPIFTYAHTLAGHEHVALEDFEEGMSSYRQAIRLDSRHYNAWYGLGTIYMRQEKHEVAEYHLQRALLIHPSSSVLQSCLGMALHALHRSDEALAMLDRAIALDKRNPLPIFQKATIYKRLDLPDQAILHLSTALDLKPPSGDVTLIKAAIEKLHLPDDEDDGDSL
eukprot:SM000250S08725  [mRNA]  locus=s250:55409:60519:- [translate_table: standard]